MRFFRLFLAFIQKLCLVSFHFSKNDKRGAGIRAGGLENFSKLISGGGTIIRYSRVGKMTKDLQYFQRICKDTLFFQKMPNLDPNYPHLTLWTFSYFTCRPRGFEAR